MRREQCHTHRCVHSNDDDTKEEPGEEYGRADRVRDHVHQDTADTKHSCDSNGCVAASSKLHHLDGKELSDYTQHLSWRLHY